MEIPIEPEIQVEPSFNFETGEAILPNGNSFIIGDPDILNEKDLYIIRSIFKILFLKMAETIQRKEFYNIKFENVAISTNELHGRLRLLREAIDELGFIIYTKSGKGGYCLLHDRIHMKEVVVDEVTEG